MRFYSAAIALLLVTFSSGHLTSPVFAQEIPNRLIDYNAFKSQVLVVGDLRKSHRISEEDFIKLAKMDGTVVLDARSDDKFSKLHVKGARHLSLPDITAEELHKLIPDKATRILIYCNNNFANSPDAFPAKAPSASLNIHTFNALFSYGYKNVFELGPLLDIHKTKIEFEGTESNKVKG